MSLLLVAEGGVERRCRLFPELGSDERDRLLRSVQPVHAGVLPLHRDGPRIADRVQGAERVLPRHVTVPGGHEVPASAGVAPGEAGTSCPRGTVTCRGRTRSAP